MLIDSLSLLFAFTSFVTWYEALLVALALGTLVFYLTPSPAQEWEERTPATLYFYLQWSWLGYLRLKDAFYPFFILGKQHKRRGNQNKLQKKRYKI